jgi:uncharacterized protein (TIGR02147 family)
MTTPETKPSVFNYKDYRAFLQDWVHKARFSPHGFSYRRFSKKAGFQSSNFLMLVMQGKRNLTEESLIKCATGLDFNKQEEEFFRSLVFLNQAHTPDQKHSYLTQIMRSKKLRQMKQIERQQYEYYSTWYHPVVRELAVGQNCDGSPEEIAKKISPEISPAQAAKSLTLLESLGFIQKTESGKWRQTNPIISAAPEMRTVIIHNYHKSVLDLIKFKMDEVPEEKQTVFTMTLGIKRERLGQLQAKSKEFREEIFRLVSEDTSPEDVVLLNVQMLPVTKLTGDLK